MVPVVSVIRVSGQQFVYVAEGGEGKWVARQRAVTLGSLLGNNYVVLSGLQAGERVIVAGVQKIGDGAPVQTLPPGGGRPGGPGGPGGREGGDGRGGRP